MSSISEKGKEGEFRLSGRGSIHNHGTDCPFWHREIMGRYGLNTNKQKEQGMCSTAQEGTDEVDNIMSKLARAPSPMTTRKVENFRRNSFNLHNQSKQINMDYSEEDSKLLSKSSPAIFSPYSCCSEEAEEGNDTNYTNESTSSSSSHNRINSSGTNNTHTRPLLNHHHRRNIDDANFYVQHSATGGSKKILFGSIVTTILVVIVAVYYSIFTAKEGSNSNIYDKVSFYNDVIGVGNKYKVSDNSILQVRAGITAIFERQDTGSFIFAYNSDRRDFNLVDFNNFVNELASAAAKYLRNHTKTIQHFVVDTSNLQIQSDKELMNEYVGDLDETGVMLVKDLDRVPSTMAMAFHYYCDEYNPLVKKSAIFFTLNIARCSNMYSEKHTYEAIEKCLAEKWDKMPHDNLRPLLNRIVNVVIDVTSDF